MSPLEIRISLLRKGYTNRRVARDLGRADSTVSDVIQGRGRSLPIARHISKITGIPVSELWPGNYPDQKRGRRKAA